MQTGKFAADIGAISERPISSRASHDKMILQEIALGDFCRECFNGVAIRFFVTQPPWFENRVIDVLVGRIRLSIAFPVRDNDRIRRDGTHVA